MNPIIAVEDAIKQLVNDTLPGKLKVVDTLPGAWSYDLIKKVLQKAPAVYVAFLGGRGSTPSSLATIPARFDVYFISKEADEETRRRGNPRVIGCYDMINYLAPVIHDYNVTDVGSLVLTGIDNLFGEPVFDLGGTVYAATFEIKNLVFEGAQPVLDNFTTFHSESTLAPDAPVTIGETTLI